MQWIYFSCFDSYQSYCILIIIDTLVKYNVTSTINIRHIGSFSLLPSASFNLSFSFEVSIQERIISIFEGKFLKWACFIKYRFRDTLSPLSRTKKNRKMTPTSAYYLRSLNSVKVIQCLPMAFRLKI